jgi:serine protease Do
MRTILALGSMCLAAALAGPAAFGQTTTIPRARSAAGLEAAEAPYLGVGGQDVTADRARTLKLKEERGVEVTSVEADSAAAKAGLKEGDVVLEYNGQKVEGWEHLKRLVHETPIHREIKIGVWRNGAVQTLTATVGSHREMPFDPGNGPMALPPLRAQTMPPLDIPQFRTFTGTSVLGIMGEELGQESQLADFFGVKDGVLVRSVTKGSAAEKAGLKAGDVITKVDAAAISTPQQITSALRAARSKGSVTVTLVRNKKEMSLGVTLDTAGTYRGRLGIPELPDGAARASKILWR